MDLIQLPLPAIIALGALVFMGVGERALHVLNLAQPDSPQAERKSLWWLQLSYFGSIIYSLVDMIVLRWTIVRGQWTYLGVPLVLCGLIVRAAARLSLGKNFSGRVQTFNEHRLITTGIYCWLQHPAYLAFVCFLMGYPVCFGSVGGLMIALFLGVPAVVYRMRIEEAALATWFGKEYRDYQQRTARLVPGVW